MYRFNLNPSQINHNGDSFISYCFQKMHRANKNYSTKEHFKVVYICSSLLQLTPGLVLAFSRDFSNFQVPGLLDFFSPGTTGPRDLQGL